MVDIKKSDFQNRAQKLGGGQQGVVYSYPFKTKNGQEKDIAVKIYRKQSLENNELQIETHLQRLISAFKKMPSDEQKIIKATMTVLLDTVKIDGVFKGYVMRKIPEKYLPKKKSTYSDDVETHERSLAYALNDDETKKDLQEPIIDAKGRKIIVLKLLYVLSILHRNDIIVGDISPNNILIYVDDMDQKKNDILFLDTDSFRTKNAMFPIQQPHTRDWIPPECQISISDMNKFFQTKQTDVWKISLLILRLYYSGPQKTVITTSNEALRTIATELSSEFARLVERGLNKEPDNRPSAIDMLKVLRQSL